MKTRVPKNLGFQTRKPALVCAEKPGFDGFSFWCQHCTSCTKERAEVYFVGTLGVQLASANFQVPSSKSDYGIFLTPDCLLSAY